MQEISKFLDLWLLSSKDDILTRASTEEVNYLFVQMFLKCSKRILRIFQIKLELVKFNADNSSELSYYQGFDTEGYLR